MLPLSAAVDLYKKNLEVDYILLREHERRLSERIKGAVLAGEVSLRYAVTTIPGPYPPSEHMLIAMRLLESARNIGKYDVRLLSTHPPVLEVSGWERASKTRVPAPAASVTTKRAPPAVTRRKPAAVKKKPPEDELVIVHEDTRSVKKRR